MNEQYINNKSEKITAKELLKMYLENHSAMIEIRTLIEVLKKEVDKLCQTTVSLDTKLDNLETRFDTIQSNFNLFQKIFFTLIAGILTAFIINLIVLVFKIIK